MLTVSGLDVFYGDAQALDGVALEVGEGDLVAIVGANGAGKTTLIRTIAGMLRPRAGTIELRGRSIAGWSSAKVCNLGIGQVAEGRQVFPTLTVAENLAMGAVIPRARAKASATLAEVLAMFPRLEERYRQAAGTLSGGEQQQLAIARALMSDPRLLLLDEPSLGLAPQIVDSIFELIGRLRQRGQTILLVEQNAAAALDIADRAYVLANGRVILEGTAAELRASEQIAEAYLGGRPDQPAHA